MGRRKGMEWTPAILIVIASLVTALLLAAAGHAQEQSVSQQFKMYGWSPETTLDELIQQAGQPERLTANTKKLAAQVLDGRECLHPDFPDKQIANAEPGKVAMALSIPEELAAEVIRMHMRMIEATGSGSWPPGKRCHPQLYPHDNYHATQLYIEHPGFLNNSSINREVTDEEWQSVVVNAKVWPTVENPVTSVADCKRVFVYGGNRVTNFDRPEWAQRSNRTKGQPFTMFDMSTWLALESTRRVGCYFIEKFDGPNGQHNVHEKMIPIPGSTSGFAYFNNATCGDHVTSNIDSTLSYSLGRLTGLRTHEFGHNLNLQHEFRSPQSGHRSIMSYSQDNTPFQGYRLGTDPYWVNSPGNAVEDHSWNVLRRFFGGEAAPPINPIDPDPDPPTNPDNVVIRVELKDGTVYTRVKEFHITLPQR